MAGRPLKQVRQAREWALTAKRLFVALSGAMPVDPSKVDPSAKLDPVTDAWVRCYTASIHLMGNTGDLLQRLSERHAARLAKPDAVAALAASARTATPDDEQGGEGEAG